MDPLNNHANLPRSILVGIGFGIIYLVAGAVITYLATQGLSQFILADCSEDCYFGIFNFVFGVAACLSLVGGVRAGLRAYRQNRR